MKLYAAVPLLGLCTLLASIGARADEGDVINFTPTYSVFRDNNLFRLAPGVSASSVGLPSRAETITTAGLGINFNKRFSLQQLVGSVNLVENRYQQNPHLDFRALNYSAKWLWAMGLRWNGELSVDRTQAAVSFTDFRNFQQRNVRVTENQRFELDYWFHSDWHALGGFFRNTLSNEEQFLAEGDYDARGYNVGVRYKPRSGNTLTWRFKWYDGTYRKRELDAVNQFDTAFTQTGNEVAARWQVSGKSTLNGRLEYLSREHEHFADRDFSGWTGNLDYVYSYSGKTSFSVGYRRDISSFQQLTNSYYVANELNVAAQWAATSKIVTTTRLAHSRRDYLGEIIPLPAGFPHRRDKVNRIGVDIAYLPARWIELKAGAALEKRLSNFNGLDYDDRNMFVSANVYF